MTPTAHQSRRHAANRSWRWLAILFAASAAWVARAEVSKEYQVKAAFLYNFTKFIEWSPERQPGEGQPLRIAVIGKNPFGDELEKIVHDRKVNGHSIVVMVIVDPDAKSGAVPCNVVFVPAGEEKLFEQLEEAFVAGGTLTVGESPRFASRDGIVNFTTIDNKVRFEINADAAERAGIRVSAQLQKLATVVRRKP